MPSVTDNIPGTTGSYNYHWKRTLELVGQLSELLLQDTVPAPAIGDNGEPLTPEELAANPNWYFKSYVRETLTELREFRKEVKDATAAEVTRDAAIAAGIRDTLIGLSGPLADAIADRLPPDGDVQAAVEAGVRAVLGSLD